MLRKKRVVTVAIVLAVAIFGAGIAEAGVEIRPPNVKFKLSVHGTHVEISDNATADRITVNSENVSFENIKLEDGIYTTSSLTVSVENADMLIKAVEEENIEFDLTAPTNTKSWVEVTDGGRGKPKRVWCDDAKLTEKSTLGELQTADNGWYYNNTLIYIKTLHASVNTVLVDWANIAPEVLNSFTPASADPNSAFDVKVEVRDNDGISDIEEVWLKVYENTKSQGDADSARDHYTFKWVRAGADNWFEVGPDSTSPYDHLVVASCSAGDDAKTTDNFMFNIKLGVTASPNNKWSVWVKVVDNAGEQDNQEFANKFDVNEYMSLSIDDATLTFSGDPGETDKAASENPTVCTVDANFDFNIQVKLSGDWSGATFGGSIPMASTHADQNGSSPWDLNLSAIYQPIWSSVGWGEDVIKNVYWFIDFPLPLRDDVYSTTFYVNVVKA